KLIASGGSAGSGIDAISTSVGRALGPAAKSWLATSFCAASVSASGTQVAAPAAGVDGVSSAARGSSAARKTSGPNAASAASAAEANPKRDDISICHGDKGARLATKINWDTARAGGAA